MDLDLLHNAAHEQARLLPLDARQAGAPEKGRADADSAAVAQRLRRLQRDLPRAMALETGDGRAGAVEAQVLFETAGGWMAGRSERSRRRQTASGGCSPVFKWAV